MTAFSAIDLSQLPAPTVIETSDFETILAEVKAWLIARAPEIEPYLAYESEPIVAVLEAWAYRELLLRQAFDEAGRGNMLAFATGAQLDHLAAFYGVARLVVQAGDASAVPPVEEILETDDAFRRRVQLALEGFSTAGPRGAYVFWGLSADATIKDIGVESPTPGDVVISVLSNVGDGTPGAAVLTKVYDTLTDEDIRPLTDNVTVQAATIVPYDVVAELTLYPGPDEALVKGLAEAALQKFVTANHALGHDITLSGIHAALHQEGVQNVAIADPGADLVIPTSQAAYCNSITVTVAATRDV